MSNTFTLVSIHAPVMDAKLHELSLRFLHRCFNPRARDGREISSGAAPSLPSVSIHAPVMDANYIGRMPVDQISFNPRARDGREVWFNDDSYMELVSIHAPVMDANV